MILDVGCGSRPKGDVNVDFFKGGWNRQEADQDKGEFVDPKKISNYVVASAEFLPFKSGVFDVVYSSHTIEHVINPFRMFSELVRVSCRKVVVKGPHCRGSGARRPFHVSYVDEDWFRVAAGQLGLDVCVFVSVVDDAPVTQRLFQITPRFLRRLYSRNIFYRVIRKVERKLFASANLPLELTAHVTKQKVISPKNDELIFIVVFNDIATYRTCFLSGIGVQNHWVVGYNNISGVGLGEAYNNLSKQFLAYDAWLVFCHQDFILNESLVNKLRSLNRLGVYGPIGSRLGASSLVGQVVQTDGSLTGAMLSVPMPVDALDEMCLIVHTEALRNGLQFDERFTFHYYGADLCTQAKQLGYDVLAIPMDCQHKSKTLSGDIFSKSYRDLQALYRRKWKHLLPLTTTTGVLKNE